MKKEIAEKWVAALRSGEYKQTKHVLRSTEGFCCLGVLCELFRKERADIPTEWGPADEDMDGRRFFHSPRNSAYEFEHPTMSAAVLPKLVQEWAGLESDCGGFNESDYGVFRSSLAELNDSGLDFQKIAEIIEKNVDTL